MKKLALSTAVLLAFGVTGMAHAERIQADLTGYEEVPALSTPAGGQFRAMIGNHEQLMSGYQLGRLYMQ